MMESTAAWLLRLRQEEAVEVQQVEEIPQNVVCKRVASFHRQHFAPLQSCMACLSDISELHTTWTSLKIEGLSKSKEETEKVLRTGTCYPKGYDPTTLAIHQRECMDILNHQEAIRFLHHQGNHQCPIAEDLIVQLHQIVMKGSRGHMKEVPGQYRKSDISVGGVNNFPSPQHVSPLMNMLVLWINSQIDHGLEDEEVLQVGAELHYRFVTIHPFWDGNGRVGRLLMNYYFERRGYPPLWIPPMRERAYLQSLEDANKETQWDELPCQALTSLGHFDAFFSSEDEEGRISTARRQFYEVLWEVMEHSLKIHVTLAKKQKGKTNNNTDICK